MKKPLFNLIALSLLIVSQTSCEKSEIDVDSQTTNESGSANLSEKIGPWQLVLDDQFTTNLNNWNLTNRADYNSAKCFYSSSNPKIASLDSKSCLELSASGTTTFTSGHVKSKIAFSPGTNEEYSVQASIKMLAKSGTTFKGFAETYGAWPAFWTVNETAWPTKGEIDIMEAYSFGGTANYASNLFYGTATGANLLGSTAEKKYTNTEGWHTYKQSWKNLAGVVTVEIFLDGVKVSTYTNSINANLKLQNFNSHSVIFNLNVSSDTGIFDTTKINLFTKTYMYVDWVKIEKRTL